MYTQKDAKGHISLHSNVLGGGHSLTHVPVRG